jgi:hypothetical protein
VLEKRRLEKTWFRFGIRTQEEKREMVRLVMSRIIRSCNGQWQQGKFGWLLFSSLVFGS